MATGERLREERNRLKMTQVVFAERGGIGVSALKLYEGNERESGSDFLSAIASEGADVQYILTGIRSNSALAADEQILLEGYRALDPATKKRMLAFVLTESGPAEVSRKIKEKSKDSGSKTVTVTATGRGAQAAGKKIVNRGKNAEQSNG